MEKTTTGTPATTGTIMVAEPAAAPETADKSAVAATPAKNRKPTAGEKIFDRTVYTGIGFGVNEALSLYIAVEVIKGWGKKGFDKSGEFFARFFKEQVKNGVKYSSVERARNVLTVGALLIGGTLVVIPMKLIEDHKAYWVKRINHWKDKRGSNQMSEAEVAARDAEVEAAIACEPKQSWGSLIAGRVIAIAGNMSFANWVMGKARNDKIAEFTEKHGMELGEKLMHSAGGPNSAVGKVVSNWRYREVSNLLGIETIYTALSSFTLEVASKFLAKKKPEVKDPEHCTEAHTEEAKQDEAPQKRFTDDIAPRKPLAAHRKEESFTAAVSGQKQADAQTGLGIAG